MLRFQLIIMRHVNGSKYCNMFHFLPTQPIRNNNNLIKYQVECVAVCLCVCVFVLFKLQSDMRYMGYRQINGMARIWSGSQEIYKPESIPIKLHLTEWTSFVGNRYTRIVLFECHFFEEKKSFKITCQTKKKIQSYSIRPVGE